MRYRERTPEGETGAEVVATYSDYRGVKGLQYPYAVEVAVGGQTDFWAETRSLLVDEGVTETIFEPPDTQREVPDLPSRRLTSPPAR